MGNLIIILVLSFQLGMLLLADSTDSFNDTEDFLTELLSLHQEYCDSGTDLCTDDSEREPSPLMFPMPCCIPCSCGPTCRSTHTCCPGYLIHLHGEEDIWLGNASTQSRQESHNDRETLIQPDNDLRDILQAEKNKTNLARESEFFKEGTNSFSNITESANQSFLSDSNAQEGIESGGITSYKMQMVSTDAPLIKLHSENDTSKKLQIGMKTTICVRPQIKYYPNRYPDSQAYEMVDSCSKEGAKCHSGFHNKLISDMIPVTSVKSGITYVNKHCYLCNEPDKYEERAVYTWKPMLVRKQRRYISHLYESPQSILPTLETPGSNILFLPPKYALIQACQLFDVISCNETGLWEYYDKLIENMCSSGYNLPVRHTVGGKILMFKNIACVICNIRSESLEKSLSCGYSLAYPKHFISMSLNIETEDFDVKASDTEPFTEFYIKKTPSNVPKPHLCQKGYIHIMNRCRKLYCPRDHYMHGGSCKPLYDVVSGLYLNIKLKIITNQTIHNSGRHEFTEKLKVIVESTLNRTVSLQMYVIHLWFLPRSKMNSKEYYVCSIYLYHLKGKFKYSLAIKEIYEFYMSIQTQSELILSTGINLFLKYVFGNEFVLDGKVLIDKSIGMALTPLDENWWKEVVPDSFMTVSDSTWCYMVAITSDELQYDTMAGVLKVKQTNITIYTELFDPSSGLHYLCIDLFTAVQHSTIVSGTTYIQKEETYLDEAPWYFSKTFVILWFVLAAIVIGMIVYKLKSLAAEQNSEYRTTVMGITRDPSDIQR